MYVFVYVSNKFSGSYSKEYLLIFGYRKYGDKMCVELSISSAAEEHTEKGNGGEREREKWCKLKANFLHVCVVVVVCNNIQHT